MVEAEATIVEAQYRRDLAQLELHVRSSKHSPVALSGTMQTSNAGFNASTSYFGSRWGGDNLQDISNMSGKQKLRG